MSNLTNMVQNDTLNTESSLLDTSYNINISNQTPTSFNTFTDYMSNITDTVLNITETATSPNDSQEDLTEVISSNDLTTQTPSSEWISNVSSGDWTSSSVVSANWTPNAPSHDWKTTVQSSNWTTLNTSIETATSSDWITEATRLNHYSVITSDTYTNNWTFATASSTWVGDNNNFNFTNVSTIDPFTTEGTRMLITSGDLLIKANHEMFIKHLLPSLIYVSILMAIGIPGNALILFVYGKRWAKTTSRNFILALAAYDLFNTLCSISVEILLLARFLLFDMPSLCKVSRFITGVINHGSTFVLVAIAYDRYRRICQPLRVPFNPEIAKKIVMCSVVFAVVTAWPALLLYGTYSVYIPMTISNSDSIIIGKTCLIDDEMIKTKYPLMWILFLLLSHFAVDITFVVLYTCVGRAVFKRRSKLKTLKGSYKKAELSTTFDSSDTIEVLDEPSPKKKTMTHMSFVFHKENCSVKMNTRHISASGEGRKNSRIKDLAKPLEKKLKTRDIRAGRTTVMLFFVTVVFIVSYIPHTALVILRSRDPSFYVKLTDTGKVVYQLLLRSYFLNCVLNPIVYCFVNKQFRKECKKVINQIFCCKSPENIEIRR